MATTKVTDVENALLACCITGGRKTAEEVIERVHAEDFVDLGNRVLFETIVDFVGSNNGPLNLVSIVAHAKETGLLNEIGGAARIASLETPTVASAGYFADVVASASKRRKLAAAAERVIAAAKDQTENIDDATEKLAEELEGITTDGRQEYARADAVVADSMNLLYRKKRGEIPAGISTGFASLDKFLGGFRPAEMTIIGARPSVGKTALALSMAAAEAVKLGQTVGFFSLEMSREALINRLLSNLSHIDAAKFFDGSFTAEEDRKLMLIQEALGDKIARILIDDSPNLEYSKLRARARQMVKKDGAKIIFVDYLGLIEHSDRRLPRWEQMSQISRGLKQLARELEVPIVLLCQVNRDAGKDRPPMIADLRDSGAIEQDADVIILLDDPARRLDENGKIEFYDKEISDDELEIRAIKAIVAKQRNGSTGAANLAFVATYAAYKEMPRH